MWPGHRLTPSASPPGPEEGRAPGPASRPPP
jgi:hypothetical protein